MSQISNTKTEQPKKENETFKMIKSFSKVLILEGREKLADGLITVAEKIDITDDQKKFCESFHSEIEQKRMEKESKNLSGAKA